MKKARRMMAVASAGGHWIQLMRLRPAFSDHDVRYVSTFATSPLAHDETYRSVRDASMWNKWGLLIQCLQVSLQVLVYRPHVIITTGAAPGFFAIVIGRLLGANTIWIDSVANSEELSLAGRQARRWARHWLTQWPHLAVDGGPRYLGSVL